MSESTKLAYLYDMLKVGERSKNKSSRDSNNDRGSYDDKMNFDSL